MPPCPHCGIVLSSNELAGSSCPVCSKPLPSGDVERLQDSSGWCAGTAKRERDEAFGNTSTEGVVVTIPLSEQDVSFRRNSLDGVSEMIIDDRLLPPYCCVCASAGSSRKKVRFLDPLPAYFWYVVIGGPTVMIAALLVALGRPPEAAQRFLTAVATLVGLGAGLLAGQGALRRGRNVVTIYLCDEHSTGYRKLDRRRIVAKTLFVLVMVAIVAWLPLTVIALIVDSPIGFALRVTLAGSGPIALAVTIVLMVLSGSRLARHIGLVPSLKEGKLLLACRSPEFAEQVTTHIRNTSTS